MKEHNANDYVFGDGEEPVLNLDITTEIYFSRKDHPEGKLVPVSVDGKEEFILIPLDVKHGSKLTYEGRGKYNPKTGKIGNLYVQVHIEEKGIPWRVICISAALLVLVIAGAYFILIKPVSPPPPPTAEATLAQGVAESCMHDWLPANCTTPKLCSLCGETIGEPADHQWGEATCTAPQICEVCGEKTGTTLEHQWLEATYDTPMTCAVCGIISGGTKKPGEFADIWVGKVVKFGSYEQDGNRNERESIEWIVLDIRNGQALLMSKFGLESRPFHTHDVEVTWEDCSLRSWLNDTFLYDAFSAEERGLVLTTNVSADRNPDYDTDPGAETQDKVFLLSTVEAKGYYPDYKNRVCTPTQYAMEQGAFLNKKYDGGWWWLRTPGEGGNTATSIDSNGSDDSNGSNVTAQRGMVRPVMWVATE